MLQFLNLLISTRTIVAVTCVLAYITAREGVGVLGGLDFRSILVIILAVAGISISRSAFSSFDIQNKRAFILDIIWDVLFLCGAVAIVVFVWAMNIYFGEVPWEAFAFAISSCAVAMIDFLVSLNGGAGKLLEMNREHYARDRES